MVGAAIWLVNKYVTISLHLAQNVEYAVWFLQIRSFLIKVFLQNNSLDRTVEVMAYHPKYLSLFLNTQRFLMQADGPLSFQERHYIAILVSETATNAMLIIGEGKSGNFHRGSITHNFMNFTPSTA